ncbi:MAG: GNAT family N-acetyltransferase [candidate division Zixibacteria bacterium]|nr:GNAT family N-acetyltransferase [candidate division Zixibacteria bacterium]
MKDKKTALPTQPSLVGDQVYLRPATADDVANNHVWFILSEPQAQGCQPLPFHTASEAAEAFKKKEATADYQAFAIVRREDKTLVGKIVFYDLNSLNRSAGLGLLIDPDERKKGYAADAMRVLTRFLFQYRGLNKVYAQTPEFNAGAARLLESLGFKRDACLRDHHFYNGKFYNSFIYSLLLFEADL